MRVLHAGCMSEPMKGVINQVQEEQAAADNIGIAWKARLFVPRGWKRNVCVEYKHSAKNRIYFKRAYYSWLEREVKEVDVLVLRYSFYDPLQLAFISKINKPVFLVHHTLEIPEINRYSSLSSKLKTIIENVVGRRSINAACGIISVTSEIGRYECSRAKMANCQPLIYPNGVGFNKDEAALDLRSDTMPEFLFLASEFVSWHGLDRILDAARRSVAEFKVHLVGKLDGKQMDGISMDRRFIAHGVRNSAYIKKLMAKAWVGLSSFALDRKGMEEACTLKVREYLRSGLPVYAGHKDVFPEDYVYFRRGRCEFDAMLAYAFFTRGHSRKFIAQSSRVYIDKSVLLRNLYGELRSRLL